MSVTGENITLRLFVSDIAGILSLYDNIQVFRSTGDETGPWERIAGSATPAIIVGTDKTEPFALNGKNLYIKINNVTTVGAVFMGADPYSLANAIVDLNTALGALGLAIPSGSSVQMSTTAAGTAASIELTGGTALFSLGFQTGAYDIGENPAIALAPGTQDYTFIDHNGSEDYWYCIRYWNSVTMAVSEYGIPFPAKPIWVMPGTDLITGYANMVDLHGRALKNQLVTVYNVYEPSLRSGFGILGTEVSSEADDDGHVELALVRGSLVEVAFTGTPIRRRIRVPTTGSSFDLLDATLADDEFGIQTILFPIVERRFP